MVRNALLVLTVMLSLSLILAEQTADIPANCIQPMFRSLFPADSRFDYVTHLAKLGSDKPDQAILLNDQFKLTPIVNQKQAQPLFKLEYFILYRKQLYAKVSYPIARDDDATHRLEFSLVQGEVVVRFGEKGVPKSYWIQDIHQGSFTNLFKHQVELLLVAPCPDIPRTIIICHPQIDSRDYLFWRWERKTAP